MTANEKQLYLAALRNELETVRELISAGTDVNAANSQGNTPLHAAALNGHAGVLALLLDNKADATRRNRQGVTPLSRAFSHLESHAPENIDETCAMRLLEAGAAPAEGVQAAQLFGLVEGFFKANIGYNPDRAGTEKYDAGQFLKLVRMLLDKGLDSNTPDDHGRTLLHYACEINEPPLSELVALLIRYGADVNIADDFGATPAHLYMRNNRISADLVKRLAGLGFDMTACDRDGCTPLHWLCMYSQCLQSTEVSFLHPHRKTLQAVCTVLVEMGCDGNQQDNNGMSPLMHIRHRIGEDRDLRLKCLFVMDILKNGRDAVHGHIGLPRSRQFAYAKRLLAGLPDAETLKERFASCYLSSLHVSRAGTHSEGGDTLPELAARCQYDDMEALLEGGADPAVLEPLDGRTPMHQLGKLMGWDAGDPQTQTKIKACIDLLLRHGGDLNAGDNKDCTALHLCMLNDYTHKSGPLLQAGADMGVVDKDGKTPLHIATDGINPENTKQLIRAGAPLNAMDSNGDTPLHLCLGYPGRFGNCNHTDYKVRFLSTLDALLEGGTDLDVANRAGQTPLASLLSTCLPNWEIETLTEKLLLYGADPDVGCDALQSMFKRRAGANLSATEARAVLTLLVESGMPLNRQDTVTGDSPLHRLCRLGVPASTLDVLLANGADPTIRNAEGDTPIMLLLRNKPTLATVTLLAEKGADMQATDRSGKCLTEIVQDTNHENAAAKITELLLNHGAEPATPQQQPARTVVAAGATL